MQKGTSSTPIGDSLQLIFDIFLYSFTELKMYHLCSSISTQDSLILPSLALQGTFPIANGHKITIKQHGP